MMMIKSPIATKVELISKIQTYRRDGAKTSFLMGYRKLKSDNDLWRYGDRYDPIICLSTDLQSSLETKVDLISKI